MQFFVQIFMQVFMLIYADMRMLLYKGMLFILPHNISDIKRNPRVPVHLQSSTNGLFVEKCTLRLSYDYVTMPLDMSRKDN